jgi:hypothetical protein
MMVNYIEVLDPTGKPEPKNAKISAGIGNIDGKTIGLIDNGKPNYDIFLARLEELLRQRFSFADVIHVKKGEKGTVAPLNKTDLANLADNCHLVLNGICD